MRLVAGVIALLVVMVPGASAQDKTPSTPNPLGSTAIEQALIEHACRSQLPGIAGVDAYQQCLADRLRSLRADFGRDLGKVSAADRKTLDSACSKARAAEGREAYLECLTVQLGAIRNRQSPGRQASDVAPFPESSASPESDQAVPPTEEPPSSFSPVWIVVGVVTLVAAIGGAYLFVQNRRAIRKCRVCGSDVPQGGDLCPTCRHEAAEALRQAAAERLGQARALAEEQAQQSAREEEQRRQRARDEEAARLRREEEARQREEDARRKEQEVEESRQRSRAGGVDSEDLFDPYAILGVAQDASKDAIETACQQARLKYAPEQVAHLGSELQEHYRQKAEAVERAYKILTE